MARYQLVMPLQILHTSVRHFVHREYNPYTFKQDFRKWIWYEKLKHKKKFGVKIKKTEGNRSNGLWSFKWNPMNKAPVPYIAPGEVQKPMTVKPSAKDGVVYEANKLIFGPKPRYNVDTKHNFYHNFENPADKHNYICRHCGEGFGQHLHSKLHLVRHLLQHHPCDEPYECLFCCDNGFSFATNYTQLVEHMLCYHWEAMHKDMPFYMKKYNHYDKGMLVDGGGGGFLMAGGTWRLMSEIWPRNIDKRLVEHTWPYLGP